MAAFKVQVEGLGEFRLEDNAIENIDLVETAPDTFHIIKNNKNFKAEILHVNLATKSITINVNGKKFKTKIADEYDQLVKKMGLSAVVTHKINEVKAPMPGLVLDILTEPGAHISKDDSLIILEAMKMENVIKSPGDGQVKNITVEKGSPVEKGAILIELE